METGQDFRSERSGSLEGYGIARARWTAFHDQVNDQVYADIAEAQGDRLEDSTDEVPSEVLEEINDYVIEQSELLGFWLAWHLAGGFGALEQAGWHRATIHRKIRHFRTFFGKHPDEYRHPFLNLNLEKAWEARLRALLKPTGEQ
jgi:hypothetical protein